MAFASINDMQAQGTYRFQSSLDVWYDFADGREDGGVAAYNGSETIWI